ncbi:MAG: potassium channel family protein [Methanotrichaceae archaeon]|nr:potassium channel family protein [Methanotrichaceae archaeon]
MDLLFDPEARPIFIYALANLLIGATLYSWLEGWSFLDSMYFMVVTLCTIGYGDLTPTKPITKLLTIFVALNGVVILLMLFDEIRRMRAQNICEVQSNLESLRRP